MSETPHRQANNQVHHGMQWRGICGESRERVSAEPVRGPSGDLFGRLLVSRAGIEPATT